MGSDLLSELAKNAREALASTSLFGFAGTERSGASRRAFKETGLVVPADEGEIVEALNQPQTDQPAEAPAERSETA